MLEANKSPRTIQYCFATFRQVWNAAKSKEFVNSDTPSKKIKIPKFDNKRLRFLSQEEADNLLKKLKSKSKQIHNISLLSFHTGLRAGEIFNLRWGDVDLNNKSLTIRDSKSGKTRYAYLTEDTKQILNDRYDNQGIDEPVFCDRYGRQITYISHSFDKVVKELRLNEEVQDRRQKVTFHTLRHTFASWLVQEGTDLYVVKELLGHHSIQLTERYSHLQPDGPKRAVKIFDQRRNQNEDSKIINFGQ